MSQEPLTERRGTLGTFAGVFTPSVLTILGIIFFLRTGFIVGNAGLPLTLAIIALATSISVFTSFSLSAIATNLRVGPGGDYFLISRTLGVRFGGALGVVLFLAQSVSVAFYTIGFGEVVATLFGAEGRGWVRAAAAAAVLALFVLAWLGADWASRFQHVVMGLLVLGVLSFFVGAADSFHPRIFIRNLAPPGDGLGFWATFAIFFPAVTGFTQGVSMSGDLKDPGKSLPVGTFSAVGVSTVVYLLAAVAFSGSIPLVALRSNFDAMSRIASLGFLVDVGVVAATLSSAMASFLGGPRILQSMASDRIIPALNPFAKGAGPARNPRRAVVVTLVIALATISLGSLNVVAPVITMFFLVSYGLLNYATYFEARAASPSFRPRFRLYDKRLSLAGAVSCLVAMLAVNIVAGVAAVALLFLVYRYLKSTVEMDRWSDSSRSHHFQIIREHIWSMSEEIAHPRDWRPVVLAFSDSPQRRARLLRFASWISGDWGIAAAVRIIEGTGALMRTERDDAEKELRREIADLGLEVFPLAVLAPDPRVAVETVVQSVGLGSLKANVVLVNWLEGVVGHEDPETEEQFGDILQSLARFRTHIAVFNTADPAWARLDSPDDTRRIDVWWRDDNTSNLMLLMSYLFTRHAEWRDATIRLLAPVGPEADPDAVRTALELKLREFRIDAEPQVVLNATAESVRELCADATIAFLPFRLRKSHPLGPFDESVGRLLGDLPTTCLVLAAEDVWLDAEPDEGPLAQLSVAKDAAKTAHARAKRIREEAAHDQAVTSRLRRELKDLPSYDQTAPDLRRELREAEEVAEKSRLRAVKAEAIAKIAEAEAAAIESEVSRGPRQAED